MTDYVSVIVPVYNDQTGIDACLVGLGSQTLPKDRYEVIVVDNNSVPPIRIDPIFSDFARLSIERTPGAYVARNAGIKISRGTILAFTDADCTPDPNWLEAGVRALNRGKGNYIIGGEVAFLPSKIPTAVEHYQALTGFQQRENIEHLKFSATANTYITRDQIMRIGFFDQTLLSGGDREWAWRAKSAGLAIKYASDVIVHTIPRRSLSSAIRQARRVAGGRYALHHMRLAHIPSSGLKPHQSGFSAAKWILTYPELSSWNRFKIFSVALTLKTVGIFETARLSFGGSPERR